jgi:hypothetical protein
VEPNATGLELVALGNAVRLFLVLAARLMASWER